MKRLVTSGAGYIGSVVAHQLNLGNGSGYSNRQVLATVREVTGRDFPVTTGPRRPGDPAVCIASSAKASDQLGWTPQRPDLADIIDDAWDFHRTVHGDSRT